jgi:integrase/recombinase XerC
MTHNPPSHHRLNLSLKAKIGSSFDLNLVPDVLSQLLADSRSENTRLAYEKDVVLFFKWATGNKPTSDIVLEFLHLEKSDAVTLVLRYKAHLIRKGLAEATVNRRLAALKSLVAMGRKMGHCVYSLEDIKAEKVQRYRDTTGISPEEFKRVLSVPDRDTLQGKRDYALLRLLWGNALRRNEISQLNIGDFNQNARTLLIRGKGKGSQTEAIDLSRATKDALAIWLEASHDGRPNDAPLFIALDFCNYGHRLTGESIRRTVVGACIAAGINKRMSPHRIRHSAITAALDATDGNVRKVQKLSRHANLETLMVYDDNREKAQLEITELLDDLI